MSRRMLAGRQDAQIEQMSTRNMRSEICARNMRFVHAITRMLSRRSATCFRSSARFSEEVL